MKRKIIYVAIAGLSLLAASATSVYADTKTTTTPAPATVQAHQMHQERADLHKLKMALKKLNLTDAQKQKIKGIFASAKPQMKQYAMQMKENRKEIKKMMRTHYNKADLDKLTQKQGDLHAQTLKLRLQVKHDVWAELTPDQRKQLKEMKKNIHEKAGRKFHQQHAENAVNQ